MYEAIFERITETLKGISSVRGIVLGGSRATGMASENSDIDIGIYYDYIDYDAFNAAAKILDDKHRDNLISHEGEWGNGVNCGGWLTIDGIPVDLIMRDIKRVRKIVDDSDEGIFSMHYQTGHPEKQRFMCLSEGYHGETIGALSVGSMDLYAKIYKPMLMNAVHTQAPDCYRCPFNKNRDNCSCECFKYAEEDFVKYGKELAAVIVEPLIQGSAGMRIYPPLYLEKLRICNL